MNDKRKSWQPTAVFVPEAQKTPEKSKSPASRETITDTNVKRKNWAPEIFVPDQERKLSEPGSSETRFSDDFTNLDPAHSPSPSGISQDSSIEALMSRLITPDVKATDVAPLYVRSQATETNKRRSNSARHDADSTGALPPPKRGLSVPSGTDSMVPDQNLRLDFTKQRYRSSLSPEDVSKALAPPPRSHSPLPNAGLEPPVGNFQPLKPSDKETDSALNFEHHEESAIWNDTMFVSDPAGKRPPSERPHRPQRHRGETPTSNLSRKLTLIVDRALLDTRLEWNQQLVAKTFRPYLEMICAMDDDLPDPQDLETFEDDDYDDHGRWRTIRDEMLHNAELTEREIAAFFEGVKLFQLKVNSLKSQLDGMKAMLQFPTRPKFMSMRAIPQSTRDPQFQDSSVPKSLDRKSLMKMARTSISGDPGDKVKQGTGATAPATNLAAVDSPPRMSSVTPYLMEAIFPPDCFFH